MTATIDALADCGAPSRLAAARLMAARRSAARRGAALRPATGRRPRAALAAAALAVATLFALALVAIPGTAAAQALDESRDLPGLAQTAQSSLPTGASAGQADPFAADQALVDYLLNTTTRERPPEALVDSLYDDPANARRPMAIFLSNGEATPEERAHRAVVLARGIIDSPRARTEPDTRDQLVAILLEIASQVVCSTRFVRAEVAEGYVPRLSTFPYDFGGPASQVATGFTLATPLSSMFTGGRPLDHEGLGTGALLFDGISGLDQISLFVPNGRYILILLTAVGGNGEVFRARINGIDHWVAWTPASEWPMGAPLVLSASLQPASIPVGGTAGKLSLPVRVADGTVSIDFDDLPAGLSFASLELVLYDEDVGPDLDEEDCLKWDRAQRAATRPLPEDDDACIAGACPIDDPVDPSPSGAT